jgi:hypothetical protein
VFGDGAYFAVTRRVYVKLSVPDSGVFDVLTFVYMCTIIRKVLGFSSAVAEVSWLYFTMSLSAEYSIS